MSQQNNQQQQPLPQQSQPLEHPALADWKVKNASWFNRPTYDEMQMTAWALQRDQMLRNLNLPPEEHYRHLDEHVKKQFSDYFNPVSKSQGVESGANNNISELQPQNQDEIKYDDLEYQVKKLVDRRVAAKLTTREDYMRGINEYARQNKLAPNLRYLSK